MRRFPDSLVKPALGAALLAPLAGCATRGTGFLDPHGPVAALQRALFFEIVGWMMIVVLPVLLLVPLFAWRYRRRNTAAVYRPDWTFNRPLEFALWGVPIAVVAVLSYLVLRDEIALDPYAALASKQKPLQIEVVGLDWKWLFIYPEQHIATVGQLALPLGRPVHFRLTSDTVMQSFAIPALGSQIYAMAGMVTQLNVEAERPGSLRGLNTQYNGDGFPRQTFSVPILTSDDFKDWVDTVRVKGRALDPAGYALLSQRGTAAAAHRALATSTMPAGALYFSGVAPGFFAAIVGQYHQVAAGVLHTGAQ
ncbi:MAG: cytochrome ubiquinol oxidase subunit II [Rhodopseudomonas sp.]|nr:cytochrome ubiquinol oxidase subunit II [Rhodopseudomonas sp.]